MEMNDHDIDLMEAYLKGELNDQERRAVVSRLESDESFRSLFNDFYLLQKVIKEEASQRSRSEALHALKVSLKDQIEEESDEDWEIKDLPVSTKSDQSRMLSSSRRQMMKWAVAASVTFIGLMYWVLYDSSHNGSLPDLADDYLSRSPMLMYSIPRSTEPDQMPENELRRRAFIAYQAERDAIADSLFSVLQTSRSANSIDLYHAGQTSLQQGNWSAAIERFQAVINRNQQLVTEAKWYLALTYLKQDNRQEALSMLNQLIESPQYQAKAREIIKKLN